jgi:hypothetical protein
MTVRAFLKWYAHDVLEFIKGVDFDSKVTFVTFSAMIPIVIILGLSHVDAKVGLGVVFGTLLSVGVLLMHKNHTNRNAITNHPKPQEQQSNL